MATGEITTWNDAIGEGLVSEDGNGVHRVFRQDCTQALQDALSGKNFPPSTQSVTFGVAADNHAIHVDID